MSRAFVVNAVGVHLNIDGPTDAPTDPVVTVRSSGGRDGLVVQIGSILCLYATVAQMREIGTEILCAVELEEIRLREEAKVALGS